MIVGSEYRSRYRNFIRDSDILHYVWTDPEIRLDQAVLDNVKAVLFDLDDTLFDRHRAQRQILHMIVGEFGELFSGIKEEEAALAFFQSEEIAASEFKAGVPIEKTRISRCRKFLDILGIDPDYSTQIDDFYLDCYDTADTPVIGAGETVHALAGDYQIGIISNGSPDVQHKKLNCLNIRPLLNCIVLSEEVGVRKPDPAIFLQAASLLSIEPSKCIYVGDSFENDMIGARQAGFHACWFNPNNKQILSSETVPDIEVDSLERLRTILMRKR